MCQNSTSATKFLRADTLLFFLYGHSKQSSSAMQAEALLAYEASYSASLFRQKVGWLPQWMKLNSWASLLVSYAVLGTCDQLNTFPTEVLPLQIIHPWTLYVWLNTYWKLVTPSTIHILHTRKMKWCRFNLTVRQKSCFCLLSTLHSNLSPALMLLNNEQLQRLSFIRW